MMNLQKKNSFRILSLEAKDIYYAQEVSGGYFLPPKTDKKRYFFQFKNVFDWSLDSEELQRRYKERKAQFSFQDDAGAAYTLSVINVKFSFACNEYNRHSIEQKTVYIKEGYTKEQVDFSFSNHFVDEETGELLAIRLNEIEDAPLADEALSPYFAYDGKERCYVRAKTKSGKVKSIKHTKDLLELREELYEKGFLCEGKWYVRYKRSSGSSREGNCLFIEKSFAAHMKKWSACGLKFDEKIHDKASWEAYRALSLSSSVAMFTLPIKNILFIDDYKHCFTDLSMFVYGETGENKAGNSGLKVEFKTDKIENTIWDGESLLDESVFMRLDDKILSTKSMLLLRNRFFKTCAFRTKLQKWFKDNNVTIDTVRKYGKTFADNIEDIMMVTTQSSLKYLSFLGKEFTEENIKKWIDNAGDTFSIVKYDKKTHFFGGDLVQSSYQLLNTLPLTSEDAEKLVGENECYLQWIRKNDAALLYHLKEAFKKESLKMEDEDSDGEDDATKIEIYMRVLSLNTDFSKTKIFKDFKQDLLTDFREKLKEGHFLFKGTNATLFGNGAELLKATIGAFDRENPTSALSKGQISCTKFADGQELLGARSPHITMGNLLRAKNTLAYETSEYFVLSDEIVCVNAIGENIQDRLNGCDYDSDTMLLTDDSLLVERADVIYHKFAVPVNKVAKDDLVGQKDAEVDSKISVNKIGEIVNLSQKLNSLYWDLFSNGKAEALQDVYQDICKLAVLSGMEIDRAKRKYKVDSQEELNLLSEKYKECFTEEGKTIKPDFFKTIDKKNGERYGQRKSNIIYKFYQAPMDRLWERVSKIDLRKNKEQSGECLIIDLLHKPTIGNNDYKNKDKIIKKVEELYNEISGLRRIKRFCEGDEKLIIMEEIAQKIESGRQCVLKHCKTEGVAYLLAKEIDAEENSRIASLLFELLFTFENGKVYTLLKKDESIQERIVRAEDGDLSFYGLKHKIVKKL